MLKYWNGAEGVTGARSSLAKAWASRAYLRGPDRVLGQPPGEGPRATPPESVGYSGNCGH